MARKILLADDSVTAQNMGRKILADAGYEVITVNNGSAALKKIAEHKPDLIVLDVYMPGYSGLEVCQRLKESQETARIPVLLTVGKLEPFKPEEAKRVRADGFIVKPFEASELLSALSKLEDKVVPRAEASKPGRFARAIAAVEDSGREKNESGEQDSGWKDRISFPSKKKAKEVEEDERGDDSAFYNQAKRDSGSGPQEVPAKGRASSSRTGEGTADVAALAAELPKEGLPKDVTLEEIAAIAAAAAQVQLASGVSSDSQEQKPHPQDAGKSDTNSDTKIEGRTQDSVATQSVAEAMAPVEARPAVEEIPASATFADVRREEPREEKREEKIEAQSEVAVQQAVEQKQFEQKQIEQKKEEERKDTPAEPAASPVEVAAAISALEASNGNSLSTGSEPAQVAVAMAAAAAAATSTGGSRWMAVPVTTDAAEAALSLDQEMHKAYAAFVAVEAKSAVSTLPVPEIAASVPPPTEAPALSSVAPVIESLPAPATVVEPRATAHEESELGQALSTVANAPVEPSPAAVTEPSPVAESQISSAPSHSSQETLSSSATAEAALPAETVARQETPIPEPPMANPSARQEEPAPVRSESPSDSRDEVSRATASEPQPAAAVSAAIENPARHEPAPGGTRGMAEKRDSELAESTAAAWASWRQIRSDEPRSAEPSKARHQDDDDDEPAPPAQAAMAAAAGAEKRPEDAPSASDPKGIASIVDSVLAELRPKIVEEISRKLGEKK